MKNKQRDRYPFMPASQTAAGAQRTIQARRTRTRRGGPGSAIAEGSRSSGDSKGTSEESEPTNGSASSECQSSYLGADKEFEDRASDSSYPQITVSLSSVPRNLHLVYWKSANLQYLWILAFVARDLSHYPFRPTSSLRTDHHQARTNI